MARRILLLASLALAAILTACGSPAITGVANVKVIGGDRSVPLASSTLLTADVTAGSGVDLGVTWTSSNEAVATIATDGTLTTVTLGSTTVTATSTTDPSKSGSAVITVTQPTLADGAFMASTNVPAGFPPILGASLLLFDNTEPPVISSSSVTQIESALWSGPLAPVRDDGSVVVPLPPGSDLPDAVFSTADHFLQALEDDPTCSLVASDPTVRVTTLVFELISVPGPALFTAGGMQLSLASSAPIDFTAPIDAEFIASLSMYAWVYAESDVDVTTSATGCDGSSDPAILVDVNLTEGWNQLGWHFTYDAVADEIDSIKLTNDDGTDIYISAFTSI